ncbi:hypothetical protein SAMN02745248_00697 [Hathewaya proteolytica DSM 3090]|uniref:Uncharacterized protein n=1 Tax=Hathewaya proteolytica DSM 3090 TaxID=1121331 RepID=A0A1M6LBG0_9CLOT|nr:hypothetical protein [Hathewaya proteolytica]SHJ68560.1 hypothetical protein SAMN02745248_00697 [Hathewaya proteolytica DSM 3090]
METKLNKVDLEIRQGINEKTSESKVHRKQENIIRENDDMKHQNMNLKKSNEKTVIVDAEMNIEEAAKSEGKGLLLDRTL